eukprot:CAMPEP_0174736872 /NCGR_PEP_ID=MMETSP1094-20130205/67411_1 /TAXON_ID=156173 /ORGANISM="Chrysochromulina brevifilum, Strain UTEX LB 985" /LENGTH=126 /DNA_ID=CAMNT_0015940039 /DNA_START=344 /DNA_END=725 /DNA_ORIENTATION=+
MPTHAMSMRAIPARGTALAVVNLATSFAMGSMCGLITPIVPTCAMQAPDSHGGESSPTKRDECYQLDVDPAPVGDSGGGAACSGGGAACGGGMSSLGSMTAPHEQRSRAEMPSYAQPGSYDGSHPR